MKKITTIIFACVATQAGAATISLGGGAFTSSDTSSVLDGANGTSLTSNPYTIEFTSAAGSVAAVTFTYSDSNTPAPTFNEFTFNAAGMGVDTPIDNGSLTFGESITLSVVTTSSVNGEVFSLSNLQGNNGIVTVSGLTITNNVAGIGARLASFDLDVISVPEPSSAALLGLGGLTLIARRKRA